MQDESASIKDPKRQAIKIIARTMWGRRFKETNPDARAKTIVDTWHEETAEYVKNVSAGVRAIERRGLKITATDAEV